MVNRSGRRRVSGDSGSGMLLTLMAGAALGVLTLGLAALGEYITSRQAMERVADTAALAAATALDESGCEQGALVAAANGAVLVSCLRDRTDVITEVRLDRRLLLHRIGDRLGHRVPLITATSRAGPG